VSKVSIYFVPLLTDVAVSLPEARENMDSSPEIKSEPVVGALPVFEYSAAQDMWNEPQKERHKKWVSREIFKGSTANNVTTS
jgi:hypothetical protein